MTIEEMILEELRKDEINEAIKELNQSHVFNDGLEKHIQNYQNKKLENIVIENSSLAQKSIDNLIKYNYKPKTDNFISKLYSLRTMLEKYIDKFPKRDKFTTSQKKLYELYVKLNEYLKDIGYYKLPKSYYYQHAPYGEYQPSARYTRYYKEYKNKALEKEFEGLSAIDYLEKEKSKLDLSTTDGLVRNFAVDGVETFLFSAGKVDESERDLRELSSVSLGDKADELIISGLLNREYEEREKRLQIVKNALGIKTKELSNIPNWLEERIEKRLEGTKL